MRELTDQAEQLMVRIEELTRQLGDVLAPTPLSGPEHDPASRGYIRRHVPLLTSPALK
ncbi:hypothetical protein [Streptomyces sp. MUSC 14]|uniref:hypothetical protein n=1 Tax=Streptomyces sp. MUSC 14 TaxID=1354889 RepID=UPI0015A5D1A4|nr:hypothetical protein [Streptomyces sp. MUSC 14]